MKLNNKSSLSLFHLHACSCSKNFEDLENLLDSINFNLDVIAISETRIMKSKAPNHLSYKTRMI